MIPNLGNPRLREDLIWLRNGSTGLDRWTLKDPSNGEYFYFSSIEKDVIQLFRGDRSLVEIHEMLRQIKPGSDWSFEKLFSFLQVLLFHNLVLCEQYGKGNQLSRLVDKKIKHRRYGWLTQPLSIRIPLFRPNVLLALLRPIETLLFHPITIASLLLIGVFSLIFTALQWSVIVDSLPSVESLIRGDRLYLLLLALAIIKSLHELGHAMACHKYAGTCGEIGVMLLVFTPCLYCDVSPSWMIKSRWQRVIVALAGIYIELILSLGAIFCLLFVPSEIVRAFAVYIFILCSMGTVFLNGNPLVKYDGYFALSDFLGIPNLSEQAKEAASYLSRKCFTKNTPPPPALDYSQAFLVCYWILSTIYRFLLLILILWGINWLLRPLGLEFVAYYISVVASVGVAWNFGRLLAGIPKMIRLGDGFRVPNVVATLLLFLLILACVFYLPISDSVESRAIVRFETMTPVFIQQPGQLVKGMDAENSVTQGDTIYQLKSVDQEINEITASSEVELTSLKIRLRKELSVIAVQDDLQLPTLERTLDIRQQQLKSVRAEKEQMVYRANQDGYWFHALPSYIRSLDGKSLKPWTGFPLERQNVGAYFERGILLGWLVDREKPIIEAFVSETELSRLMVGMRTFVRVDHQPANTLTGSIVSIGTEPVPYLPLELEGDWHIMAQPNPQGRYVPETPMFRVIVALDTPPHNLLLGGKATVQVLTQPQTIARQVYRFLRQTIFYRQQQAS